MSTNHKKIKVTASIAGVQSPLSPSSPSVNGTLPADASPVHPGDTGDAEDATAYITPLYHARAHAYACATCGVIGGSVLRVPRVATPSEAWSAWHWVLAHTASLAGWVRRRVRRESIDIMRRHLLTGRAPDELRTAYQRWQATPWASLPPDLPIIVDFEDTTTRLQREYAATGWPCRIKE